MINYTLSETSLRVRHILSRQPYERKVLCDGKVSGMVMLVPIIC
jgi:hypothetical protein